MTDTTNQQLDAGVCRSCGGFYATKYVDKHRKVCPAVLANSEYAYRQKHGGEHIAIDEHLGRIDSTLTQHNADVTRIDTDYNTVFERLETVEQRPAPDGSTPPASGLTISSELDTDDDTPPVDPPTATGPIGPYSPTL